MAPAGLDVHAQRVIRVLRAQRAETCDGRRRDGDGHGEVGFGVETGVVGCEGAERVAEGGGEAGEGAEEGGAGEHGGWFGGNGGERWCGVVWGGVGVAGAGGAGCAGDEVTSGDV